MKKIIYLAAFAVVSGACTSSKIITKTFNTVIELNTLPVAEAFAPLFDGNYDMDEGSQLKVSSLLYDAEGNVILDADQVLDGYTSVCWGLNEIPGGEYSLVSVSFVESEGKALYTIEGRSNWNTLVLRNNSDLSFNSKSSLLGIAFQTITIGNEDTVKVALTPASAYVGVQYQKAAPISEPDDTTVIFTMTANMTVDFKEGQPMYSDPGIISVQVNPGDYKSYFVLPSELLNCSASYTSGEEGVKALESVDAPVVAGNSYIAVIDWINKTLSIDQQTFDAVPSNDMKE